MNAAAITADDRRTWGLAAAAALIAHTGMAAMALMWVRAPDTVTPEPVMLIELPAATSDAPVSATQAAEQPSPEYTPPRVLTPPVDMPPVRAPLPKDPVVLPPPAPPRPVSQTAPSQPASVAPPVSAPTTADAGTTKAAGTDAKAQRVEADYLSMISAHLNRRKTYPVEAKKARQEGIVTVRFTVSRDGSVSNIALRRGSGHNILDNATLDLLRRVAPLPRMPTSAPRDSITLSLPIDYSLRTH